MPSVKASTEKNAHPQGWSLIMAKSSGETSRRMTVTKLAGWRWRTAVAVASVTTALGLRSGPTDTCGDWGRRAAALGHEVAAEGIDHPERPSPTRSSGTVTMPSISGASR